MTARLTEEVPFDLERVGSAGSPLAFHRLCGCRRRQRPRLAGRGETDRLGGPLGAAPARLAPAERPLLVRAAVCSQVEQRATHWRIVINAACDSGLAQRNPPTNLKGPKA